MEKLRKIIPMIFICCFIGASSCVGTNQKESSEHTSPSSISGAMTIVTSTPTPTPTYSPGTELYGILSVKGEVVIEPKYEYLDLFSGEGLARFEDHGLWGYVNEQGVEVIPAQYEDANNFSEGLAAVKVDGMWGFIDEFGEKVIEPQFEEIPDGFMYGRCVVQDGSLKGLINTKGNFIIEPQYAAITISCNEYFIVMDEEDQYGVIDRDGKIVLDLQERVIGSLNENGYIFFPMEPRRDECIRFDKTTDLNGSVSYIVDYEYGITCNSYNGNSYLCAQEKGEYLWGIYDLTTGQFVTDRIYMDISFMGENSEFAFTEKDGLFGVLDSVSGKPILKTEYFWVEYSPDGQFSADTSYYSSIAFDYNGIYLFETQSNFRLRGFLTQFDCWVFSQVSTHDDNYGLINLQGNIVFPNDYTFKWFSDGSPYIQENEKIYSFIGNDFSIIEKGPYEEVIDYTEDSGIIIAIDEFKHCEVLDVRGMVLFSSEKPINYVIGNSDYFVYKQAMN